MTRNDLLTIVVMGLVFIGVFSFITTTGRGEISIRTPATTGHIDIAAHNERQFKQGFGFSISADLNQLEGAKLHNEIERLNLKTKAGDALQGFVVDKHRGLIVGTSVAGATLDLSLASKGASGTELVVSARDQQGKFLALAAEQIGVLDFKGAHLGFDFQRFSEVRDRRAYFVVLLDRSGSMYSVMGTVKQAAASFMNSLPGNAYCRVLSFNHELMQHTRSFVPCTQASNELSAIKASGGTNLYGAIVAAYAELAPISDSLKALVLITDGVGQGGMSKQQVLQRKNATTHVYYLGSFREEQLTGIADTYIYGEQDVKNVLGRYFTQLGDSIRNQHVIRIKEK